VNQPQETSAACLLERLVSALKALQQVRAAFCAARSIAASRYLLRPGCVCRAEGQRRHLMELGRAALKATGVPLACSTLDTPRRACARCPRPGADQLSVVTIETLPPHEGWRICSTRHFCAPARDLGKRLSRFGRSM